MVTLSCQAFQAPASDPAKTSVTIAGAPLANISDLMIGARSGPIRHPGEPTALGPLILTLLKYACIFHLLFTAFFVASHASSLH
jgi:hypothetical protein